MRNSEYGFDDASKGMDIVRERVKAHGLNPDAIEDGIILGSGLGSFSSEYLNEGKKDATSGPVVISYDDIYKGIGRPETEGSVEGHAKSLVIGPLEGTDDDRLVIAQSGREHPYEGVSGRRATYFLRIMQLLGVKTLFSSNAAGIATPHTLNPPSLVLQHSNHDFAIDSDNPLIGPNDERFGPRFPHMVDQYPEETRKIVMEIAERIGVTLQEGTYIRFKGPNYESSDQHAMAARVINTIWNEGLRRKGDDRFDGLSVGVIGMSSTYEARVAQHATQSKTHQAFQDARTFVSVATNFSASVGPRGFVENSTHEEVKENADKVREQFGQLASEVILEMRKKSS